MCGISGIYHFGNSKTVRETDVIKMRDTLVHRGPDDSGVYVSPDRKVGLATRRLKIIDLSPRGHMPMTNVKGGSWITFNGEIYNFKELRRELEAKGRSFRSRSDTEVILNMYEEYGVDCVKRLNGMFAFVIWDERKKLLFAARDHMGIKPFFYTVADGTFYFGSEIKAILAHPDFKKELNKIGLSHYLTFGSTPAPHTLFKGVQKLPAAHYITINGNGFDEPREYWNPVTATTSKNEASYIEEVRSLLRDSIRSQMVSDVPFGCFLSGGIDSSTNATMMSEALGKPVETFSVGYKDFEDKNEFEYSREIAKKLGAKTHEILLDESHLNGFLKEYAYYADDPVSDQVCFPLFWLSKLTRDSGVIVIQIGEGSDELFAGYDAYLQWRTLQRLPKLIARGLLNAVRMVQPSKSNMANAYLYRSRNGQKPFWGLAIAFDDAAKQEVLTDEFGNRIAESSYPIIENHYKEIEKLDEGVDILKQMTYIELKHRLPEFLLARADKMTMAHSVEGRVPFLDKRLVELAFNMPSDIKIKGDKPKYILKRAVEGIIPDKIIRRKKRGFSNPIGEWLKPENKISKGLTDVIFNSKLRERNVLNYENVKKIIHAHQHGDADQNFRIWTLITLSLWYDRWFS